MDQAGGRNELEAPEFRKEREDLALLPQYGSTKACMEGLGWHCTLPGSEEPLDVDLHLGIF